MIDHAAELATYPMHLVSASIKDAHKADLVMVIVGKPNPDAQPNPGGKLECGIAGKVPREAITSALRMLADSIEQSCPKQHPGSQSFSA